MNKDNKKLVRLTVLPDNTEIEKATVAEMTELRNILEKYNDLLGRRIRAIVQ